VVARTSETTAGVTSSPAGPTAVEGAGKRVPEVEAGVTTPAGDSDVGAVAVGEVTPDPVAGVHGVVDVVARDPDTGERPTRALMPMADPAPTATRTSAPTTIQVDRPIPLAKRLDAGMVMSRRGSSAPPVAVVVDVGSPARLSRNPSPGEGG
jgi:hypothetical protein